MPCLTVRIKELREFKQGLVSYSGEYHKGKLNYQRRYSNMLNCEKGNDCTYVKRNYSAPSEAANVGLHRENCQMVFSFILFCQFFFSISTSTIASIRFIKKNNFSSLLINFSFKLNRRQQLFSTKSDY